MLLVAIVSLLVLVTGCAPEVGSQSVVPSEAGTKGTELSVHFLDVGQADSALVQVPGGKALLIDGGNADDGPQVVQYLKKAGVRKLAAVVATHPHEDHIGGLLAVLAAFPLDEFYLPNAVASTRTYERLLSSLKAKKIPVREVKAGVKLALGVRDVSAEFLGPVRADYPEVNDASAVLRLGFERTAFLFMGDAGEEAERDLLRGGRLRSDVLKVAHHGAGTASGSAFLEAVKPCLAVVSVGQNNDYGHPSPKTLQRLTAAGAQIWRTDQNGTIVVVSDGARVWVQEGSDVDADR